MNEDRALEILVARIETKLDLALARTDDHEGRLRQLERRVWQAAGASAAVAGSAAAGLASLLGK